MKTQLDVSINGMVWSDYHSRLIQIFENSFWLWQAFSCLHSREEDSIENVTGGVPFGDTDKANEVRQMKAYACAIGIHKRDADEIFDPIIRVLSSPAPGEDRTNSAVNAGWDHW